MSVFDTIPIRRGPSGPFDESASGGSDSVRGALLFEAPSLSVVGVTIGDPAPLELTTPTWNLVPGGAGMNEPANGRLGNSSGVTVRGRAWANIFVSSYPVLDLVLTLRKNGVVIPGATARSTLGIVPNNLNAPTVGAMYLLEAPVGVDLAPGDFLSVYQGGTAAPILGVTGTLWGLWTSTICFSGNPL